MRFSLHLLIIPRKYAGVYLLPSMEHSFNYVLYKCLLIRGIIDSEVSSVPQSLSMASQYPQARRMECEYPHVDSRSQKPLYPVPHFLCRLVCKCHGQDIVWRHSLFLYHVCYAVSHGACLAAAGSRQNKERPFRTNSRFSLVYC